MKKAQKTLALVLAAVLLVAGTFAATVAWMTADAPEKKNVFTVGDISIELEEKVDVEGEGGTVTETSDGAEYVGVMPGDYLVKEVTIENTGNVPAYVALTVDVNNADKIAAAIENYTPAYTAQQIRAIYDVVFENWGMKYENGALTNALPTDAKLLEVETEVANNAWALTYYLYLQPGESFVPFTGLNAPAFFENDQMDMFDGLQILVDASAIQADNFETADDAFAALAGETTPVIPQTSVSNQAELKAAINEGKKVIYLKAGEYDLNGIMSDGLTLVGLGDDVKVANTTRFASGNSVGAITKAITLENVTVTNTIYTMENGSNATFIDVTFAAGVREAYGKNVKFDGCTFGSNAAGYALHFQTDSASAGGMITLTDCEFLGGKVHLGGPRGYTFTNCEFAAGTDFQVWSDIILDGCTVDGVEVTAANLSTLFPNLNAAKVTFQ